MGFLSRVLVPAISRASRRPRNGARRGSQRGQGRGFHPRVCPGGGVEVCLALTRAAALNRPALNEPGRGSVIGDGRGEERELNVFVIPPRAAAPGSRRGVRPVAREAGREGRRRGRCSRRTSTTPRCEPRWTLARGAAELAASASTIRISQMSPLVCRARSGVARERSRRDFVERVAGPPGFGGGARYPRRALASIHLAPLAARRRCVRDHLVLACADSENRSIINQSPEWPPRWLVEVLAASANDDDGSARGTTCSTCRRDTRLRLREGWRTIESVADELRRPFAGVNGAAISEPDGRSSRQGARQPGSVRDG